MIVPGSSSSRAVVSSWLRGFSTLRPPVSQLASSRVCWQCAIGGVSRRNQRMSYHPSYGMCEQNRKRAHCTLLRSPGIALPHDVGENGLKQDIAPSPLLSSKLASGTMIRLHG